MNLFRSIIWILSFYMFLTIWSPITLILLVSKRLSKYNAKFIMKVLLILLKYTMKIDYTVHGDNHQHGVFASKHMSTMDVILLEYLVDNPIFIMKKELMYIPIYGWFFLRLGFIPLDRKKGGSGMRQIKRQVEQKIKQGYNLIIFPEGTRVKPNETDKYKRGILFFAENLDTQIIPVGLNTGLFWQKNQFIKKSGNVDIYFGKAMKLDFQKLVYEIQSKSA